MYVEVLTRKNTSKVINIEVKQNPMYRAKICDELIDRFGLFGFNNKYSLGHDLFSVEDNIVVFPDGNWVTNKMYYNSQREEALLLDSKYPISVDYIEKNNEIAEQRISVSNSIIVFDMIKNQKKQEEIIKKGG